MAWWDEFFSYIKSSGLEDPNQEPSVKTLWERISDVFFQETVDILYFFLGIFTYLYFFAVAFLYLSGASSFDSVGAKIIRALAEPYLGAVGIYAILKETRKRRYALTSRHWGEFFVFVWIFLLIGSSLLAIFSEHYVFNRTLELIITLSLAIGLIYIGSVIHRP